MAVGGRLGNHLSLTTLVTKPKPLSKVTNPYSTGKPLKLDLPKLTYARRSNSSEASNDVFGWSRRSKLQAPPLSKLDSEFAEREGVQFVWGHENLSIDELNDLFELVGFPRRAPDRLELALQHTHRVIWIRSIRSSRTGDRKTRVGSLIGFARATSDGVAVATIWDVAVNPEWQKCGLGTGMIERLVMGLITDGIPSITLYAEPHVVNMYQRLGFVKEDAPEPAEDAAASHPVFVSAK